MYMEGQSFEIHKNFHLKCKGKYENTLNFKSIFSHSNVNLIVD